MLSVNALNLGYETMKKLRLQSNEENEEIAYCTLSSKVRIGNETNTLGGGKPPIRLQFLQPIRLHINNVLQFIIFSK